VQTWKKVFFNNDARDKKDKGDSGFAPGPSTPRRFLSGKHQDDDQASKPADKAAQLFPPFACACCCMVSKY
jgi:hypothetical protein